MKTMSLHFLLTLVVAIPMFLVQCETLDSLRYRTMPHQSVWPEKVPKGKIVFNRDVRPLLEMNCLECHNDKNAPVSGGLSLETVESAFGTGRNAPVIIPGDPENSLIIRVLELDMDHTLAMPPAPDKIWGIRMEILQRLSLIHI